MKTAVKNVFILHRYASCKVSCSCSLQISLHTSLCRWEWTNVEIIDEFDINAGTLNR